MADEYLFTSKGHAHIPWHTNAPPFRDGMRLVIERDGKQIANIGVFIQSRNGVCLLSVEPFIPSELGDTVKVKITGRRMSHAPPDIPDFDSEEWQSWQEEIARGFSRKYPPINKELVDGR